MLYLMIVAPYPHHTHSRSTLNIYKVFQYILHTSSLSITLCSLMKLKHIPVSTQTQYLCMLMPPYGHPSKSKWNVLKNL
jgi:hypothetical protein